MSSLFTRFLISLLLTIMIECCIALFWKVRGRDFLLVLLVNVMTNPAAVLLSMLTGDVLWIQFLIEAVVIFVEGCYYKKYSSGISRGMLFSIVANGVSYGLGILLNAVF